MRLTFWIFFYMIPSSSEKLSSESAVIQKYPSMSVCSSPFSLFRGSFWISHSLNMENASYHWSFSTFWDQNKNFVTWTGDSMFWTWEINSLVLSSSLKIYFRVCIKFLTIFLKFFWRLRIAYPHCISWMVWMLSMSSSRLAFSQSGDSAGVPSSDFSSITLASQRRSFI